MNKIPVFLHIPKNAGTYVLSMTMTLFRYYGIIKGWRNKTGWNLNLRIILLEQDRKQIATMFVYDPEEIRNTNADFKQHSENKYCNIIDVDSFKKELKTKKLILFSIVVEDHGIKFVKDGLYEKFCEEIKSVPLYYTLLRDPFDRSLSMYHYITSSSSIHEPTHGAIKFKTFEDYLNSYQLEDSWLIRNLINIPYSREITEEDYEHSCFILNQFKIKDISKADNLINEVFLECYNIDQSIITDDLRNIEKNVTLNKNKICFSELNEETKNNFLKRTECDFKIYNKYCKKLKCKDLT
jgi:hypothetical protein